MGEVVGEVFNRKGQSKIIGHLKKHFFSENGVFNSSIFCECLRSYQLIKSLIDCFELLVVKFKMYNPVEASNGIDNKFKP